ncbi:MAG: hypothetical protein ACRD51_00415, partial [Candidatus Acidiferrum sp.]
RWYDPTVPRLRIRARAGPAAQAAKNPLDGTIEGVARKCQTMPIIGAASRIPFEIGEAVALTFF